MSRTNRCAALAFVSAFLLAACGLGEAPVASRDPELVESTGAVKQTIIGGFPDTNPAHAAVAYIMRYDGMTCTGTLVTPYWIVTAAHCTWSEPGTDAPVNNPGYYSVCFTDSGAISPNMAKCSGVTEVHRHPSWDTNPTARTQYFNDVAVLKLMQNAQTTLGISPILILPSSLLSKLISGTIVEYSGFGINGRPGIDCIKEYGTCGGGFKYHVSVRVDTVCYGNNACPLSSNAGYAHPGTFCQLQNAGGPCNGDSGGPSFLAVGGTEYVIGATSWGDLSCAYYGCSTNLASFESFLAPYVGITAGNTNGHSCAGNAECKSGYCVAGICCDKTCSGGCSSCSTGICTGLSGIPCDDNDACTLDDQCIAGVCKGTLKSCSAPSDACISPGTCNRLTGQCEVGHALADGTRCNGSNACSTGDRCISGVCTAYCPPADSCHLPGTCNQVTGRCEAGLPAADGTQCDDGNPCTLDDYCSSGRCLWRSYKSCPAPSACLADGACDPDYGDCVYPKVPDGKLCDDGNASTFNDHCIDGRCEGLSECQSRRDGVECSIGTCSGGICKASSASSGSGCSASGLPEAQPALPLLLAIGAFGWLCRRYSKGKAFESGCMGRRQ